MVATLRSISCDWCKYAKRSVNSMTDEASSDEEIRELAAKHEGWTQRRVKNGSLWDFCKECNSEISDETLLSDD